MSSISSSDEDGIPVERAPMEENVVELVEQECMEHIELVEDENGIGCGGEESIEGYTSPEKKVPEPKVGMVFSSMEEVDDYFRSYGKQEGFGVVRASGATKGKAGTMGQRRNGMWTCECYGRPDKRRRVNGKRVVKDDVGGDDEDPKLTASSSKKCECPVLLYASVNNHGQWIIKRVVSEHKNHLKPTPRKSRFIHMYRKGNLTNRVRRKILNDVSVGIPISQVYSSLAEQSNGIDELGISERDVRNFVAEEKRLKMEDDDMEAMLEYFSKMAADNQNFFHMHRMDKHGYLQDILWVDARSRVAYEEFGDVVCFDATYLTNKYHLPFANFVGVNHHGQSVLLGCALISHETTETYEWVFKTWLSCMKGKAPKAILTDQAAAMRRALSTVMPETTHRWCLWHITSKFSAKLRMYAGYNEFKDELMNVIYDSLHKEEFDSRWQAFVEDNGLSENEWLKGLHAERGMWAPAYLKHLFWAGMKTTQRVESINSFFDKYVDKNTRLHEFAGRYCRAMEVRANAELEADAYSARNIRQLVLGIPVEKVFQKCYTNEKFKEVQRQCTRLCFLHCLDKKKVSENISEHVVEDRVWLKPKNSGKEIPSSSERRHYNVTFDSTTKDVCCECKYFESHGIMCRHMIKVYDLEDVKVVPDKYILQRWRKDVQRKHSRVKVAYHDPSKTDEVKRFDKLNVAFEEVCWKASLHEENVDIVLELIQLMNIRIDENNANLRQQTNTSSGQQNNTSATPTSVWNNNVSTTPISAVPGSRTRKRKLQVTPGEKESFANTPSQVQHPQGTVGQVMPSEGTPNTDLGKQASNHVDSMNQLGGMIPSGNFAEEGFPLLHSTSGVEKIKDPIIPKKVGRPRTNRLMSEAEKCQVKAKKKNNNAAAGKGRQQGEEPSKRNTKCGKKRQSTKKYSAEESGATEGGLQMQNNSAMNNEWIEDPRQWNNGIFTQQKQLIIGIAPQEWNNGITRYEQPWNNGIRRQEHNLNNGITLNERQWTGGLIMHPQLSNVTTPTIHQHNLSNVFGLVQQRQHVSNVTDGSISCGGINAHQFDMQCTNVTTPSLNMQTLMLQKGPTERFPDLNLNL